MNRNDESQDEIGLFSKIFNKKIDDEIILWRPNGVSIGFTILRDYPEDIPFSPAKNQAGENDSVCMIKVGYRVDQKGLENDVVLYVTVNKASRYLLNNHFDYDFNDPDSPTLDSLEESKRSKQPIDLENVRDYSYRIKDGKFFNKKTKKETSLDEIVNTIFNSHLKTVRLKGVFFRSKIGFRDLIILPVDPINKILFKVLSVLFGKTIQPIKEIDFSDGLTKPYDHSRLYALADEHINFLGTGITIPKKSALITAFIVVIASLFFVYSHTPIWWSDLKSETQIVQFSFVLVLIFIVDFIVPHLILSLINLLVIFRIKLWNWKPSID